MKFIYGALPEKKLTSLMFFMAQGLDSTSEEEEEEENETNTSQTDGDLDKLDVFDACESVDGDSDMDWKFSEESSQPDDGDEDTDEGSSTNTVN